MTPTTTPTAADDLRERIGGLYEEQTTFYGEGWNKALDAVGDLLDAIVAAEAADAPTPPVPVEEIEELSGRLQAHTEFLANQPLNIDISHWSRIAQDMLALPDYLPALRQLHAGAWSDGQPPYEPKNKAWLVHRDGWKNAKVAHYSSGAWWIDGNRYYNDHPTFDRYMEVPPPPREGE